MWPLSHREVLDHIRDRKHGGNAEVNLGSGFVGRVRRGEHRGVWRDSGGRVVGLAGLAGVVGRRGGGDGRGCYRSPDASPTVERQKGKVVGGGHLDQNRDKGQHGAGRADDGERLARGEGIDHAGKGGRDDHLNRTHGTTRDHATQ